ncbi:MAG: hypothetical protein ACK4ND_05715 [Cytophagaceae bacterium]
MRKSRLFIPFIVFAFYLICLATLTLVYYPEGILLLIVFLCLSLFATLSLTYNKNPLLTAIQSIAIFTFCSGAIFRFFHWPYGSELMGSGALISCFILILEKVLMWKQKKETKKDVTDEDDEEKFTAI